MGSVSKGFYLSVLIFYKVEIHCPCRLRSTDDTQAIACQRNGIKFQTNIHILSRGRTEALSCRLGGVNFKRQCHIMISTLQRHIHQTSSTLCLEESFTDCPIKALTIRPHRLVRIKGPGKSWKSVSTTLIGEKLRLLTCLALLASP